MEYNRAARNWFLTKVPQVLEGERAVFQQMALGKLDIHMQKNKLYPNLKPYITLTQNR